MLLSPLGTAVRAWPRVLYGQPTLKEQLKTLLPHDASTLANCPQSQCSLCEALLLLPDLAGPLSMHEKNKITVKGQSRMESNNSEIESASKIDAADF